MASGESHPNTAMAAFVLPMAADALAPYDAALADEMRTRAAGWLAALRAEWSGSYYPRAYLRDDSDAVVRIGDASGFLLARDAAVGARSPARPTTRSATRSSAAIDARVDATFAHRGDDPGARARQRGLRPGLAGGHRDPDVGLCATSGRTSRGASVLRNTYAAHAEAYPDVWYGIWSGPRRHPGREAPRARGGRGRAGRRPMLDFPVMNANPDAMGLLGLLRAAGIEPAPPDGLRVAPTSVPGGRVVLDLPLLRLEVSPGRVAGEYRAHNDGTVVLHVAIPGGGREARAAARSGRGIACRSR